MVKTINLIRIDYRFRAFRDIFRFGFHKCFIKACGTKVYTDKPLTTLVQFSTILAIDFLTAIFTEFTPCRRFATATVANRWIHSYLTSAITTNHSLVVCTPRIITLLQFISLSNPCCALPLSSSILQAGYTATNPPEWG